MRLASSFFRMQKCNGLGADGECQNASRSLLPEHTKATTQQCNNSDSARPNSHLPARSLAAAVPNKNTPLMCKFSDRKINGRIGSRARGVARNKTVFGLHASEMSLKKSCLCTSPGVGVRGARVTGRARRARCRRPSKSLPRANSSRLKTLADISDQN